MTLWGVFWELDLDAYKACLKLCLQQLGTSIHIWTTVYHSRGVLFLHMTNIVSSTIIVKQRSSCETNVIKVEDDIHNWSTLISDLHTMYDDFVKKYSQVIIHFRMFLANFRKLSYPWTRLSKSSWWTTCLFQYLNVMNFLYPWNKSLYLEIYSVEIT